MTPKAPPFAVDTTDEQSADEAAADVGYGRPPVRGRFKAGKSGNPRGRPKGSPNKVAAPDKDGLFDLILTEAKRTIKVNDSGAVVTMSIARAVVRTLAVNAAKGHPRSQKLFLEHLFRAELDVKVTRESNLRFAIDYKCDGEVELARRRRLGLDESDMLPHPDDIVIDLQTGEVFVKGPMTREDQVLWRKGRKLITELVASFKRDAVSLADSRQKKRHAEIRASTLENVDMFIKLTAAIGDWDR